MDSIFPWDLSVIPEKFFFFGDAALFTLYITSLGILSGLLLGLITALAKLSSVKPVSKLASAYIFLIRGTPLLLQLFIIYYGLTTIVTIPPIPSAVIALGVYSRNISGCYTIH